MTVCHFHSNAELDSSHGLPEWAEILERGDEEELMERAQRRSREQSLQQEFAARRVRVVDRLGRAYATGDCCNCCCIILKPILEVMPCSLCGLKFTGYHARDAHNTKSKPNLFF
jgi:hypothetical protein